MQTPLAGSGKPLPRIPGLRILPPLPLPRRPHLRLGIPCSHPARHLRARRRLIFRRGGHRLHSLSIPARSHRHPEHFVSPFRGRPPSRRKRSGTSNLPRKSCSGSDGGLDCTLKVHTLEAPELTPGKTLGFEMIKKVTPLQKRLRVSSDGRSLHKSRQKTRQRPSCKQST